MNRNVASTASVPILSYRYGKSKEDLDTVPLVTAGNPASPTNLEDVRQSNSEGHSTIRRTPVRSCHRLSASPFPHVYLPFFSVVH
jgi:hypothetical protein